MQRRAFSSLEALVVCATLLIVAVIVWPVFNRPVSFRDTRIPAVRYQNVDLSSALSDLYRVMRKQKGNHVDYSRHFSWQKEALKKRRVWLATHEERSLREVLHQIEKSAQVKFDYLRRPYHPGDIGEFIIRDARPK